MSAGVGVVADCSQARFYPHSSTDRTDGAMARARLRDAIPNLQTAFLEHFTPAYKAGNDERDGYPQPLDVSVASDTKSIELIPLGASPVTQFDTIAAQLSYQLIPVDLTMELRIFQPRIPDELMMAEGERVIQWLRHYIATPDNMQSPAAWEWTIETLDQAMHGSLRASVFRFTLPTLAYADDYYADEQASPDVARYIFINNEQAAP